MSVSWRFCADWNPNQELKLLEAIEEFGYGNWPSISIKVGKSPTECKSHYDHYYVNHRHNTIPDMPAICCPLTKVGVPAAPLIMEDADTLDYYPGMEITGYMPYRGDFAFEADNKAESVIANLDPDPEDDEAIVALHLAGVKIYQSRLAERAARKRMVLDYGLLDIQKQVAVDETRLTRRQLWVKNLSRPFMRFMSPTNACKFLQSHYLEAQLSNEIKKLQHYRQNGIKTFKGVALYERLLSERKRRRVNRDALVKKNCSAEENMLYQSLHQSSFKSKKLVAKETKVLDITYSAGVEKLSTEEKELCSLCRFQPEAYLQFKHILLAEFRKTATLSLAEARKLLRIDVNKTRKVYDFLKGRGLLIASTELGSTAS